ncbi:MAG: hypothetical protein HYW26_03120 [Candidatus Aenigmarchaeota archaeon]|nr:hypothetical protein [Candidatus Aenigmarchaeota archaeon]
MKNHYKSGKNKTGKIRKSFKGQIEPVGVLLIVFIGIIMIILTLVMKTILAIAGADPRSSRSYEIILLSKDPYSIAHIMMLLKPDERTIAEIALQSAITGKMPASDRDKLDYAIRNYLSGLPLEYYNVKIISGEAVTYELDKNGRRCGAKDEGFCSTPQLDPINNPTPAAPCGVGRIEISAEGKCPLFNFLDTKKSLVNLNTACCKEDVKENGDYNNPPPDKPSVARCGANDLGVCDYFCSEGRIEIPQGSNECKGKRITVPEKLPVVNVPLPGGGKTFSFDATTCCAPADKVGIAELGALVSAEVPLLYRTKEGAPVFYCVDPKITDPKTKQSLCSGELARGFCNDAANLCCVTQTIKCTTTTGKSGFCLDVQKCESIGVKDHEISKDCPASRGNTYQCCVTADLRKVKTSPPIEPTGEECNFGEKTAKDVPKIIVTVGDK